MNEFLNHKNVNLDECKAEQLRKLDGMSLKSKEIPHACFLQFFTTQEYYNIDEENNCFRITNKGKDHLYYYDNYIKYGQ